MCGRYRRTTREEELARIYRIPIPSQPDLPISYNISPSQEVFAIRVTDPSGSARYGQGMHQREKSRLLWWTCLAAMTAHIEGFCPPSTMKLLPVIQPARSETRNPTSSATSCGIPIRRKGIAAVMASVVIPNAFVKSARTASAPGVATLPGVTVFTRTPCGAISVASVLLHAFIAAFADE